MVATIFEKKVTYSCGNFQITGLACIAVGIWMNADPYVISYFVVLKRGTHDDALLGASAVSREPSVYPIYHIVKNGHTTQICRGSRKIVFTKI